MQFWYCSNAKTTILAPFHLVHIVCSISVKLKPRLYLMKHSKGIKQTMVWCSWLRHKNDTNGAVYVQLSVTKWFKHDLNMWIIHMYNYLWFKKKFLGYAYNAIYCCSRGILSKLIQKLENIAIVWEITRFFKNDNPRGVWIHKSPKGQRCSHSWKYANYIHNSGSFDLLQLWMFWNAF